MNDKWKRKCVALGAPLRENISPNGEQITSWRAFYCVNFALRTLILEERIEINDVEAALSVVALDLSKCSTLNDCKLAAFIAQFPNVQKLKLNKCVNAEAEVANAIQKLHRLKVLSIFACPKLDVKKCLRTSNVEDLSISDGKLTPDLWSRLSLQPLLVLRLQNVHLGDFEGAEQSLTQLRCLDLTNCYGLNVESLARFLSQLKQLNQLHLQHIRCFNAESAKGLPKSLRELELTWCENVRDDAVEQIIHSAPHLQVLKISRNSLLSNRSLKEFAKLEELKVVNIAHLNLTSAEGLHVFLTTCSPLEQLSIEGCAVNEEVARALDRHKQLRVLALPSTFDANWLNERDFSHLKALKLQESPWVDQDRILPLIPKLQKWGISSLDLLGCCMSEKSVEQILTLSNLQEVHLAGRVGQPLNLTKSLVLRIGRLPNLVKLHLALIRSIDRKLIEEILKKSATLNLMIGPCPQVQLEDLKALNAHYPLNNIEHYGYEGLPAFLNGLLYASEERSVSAFC